MKVGELIEILQTCDSELEIEIPFFAKEDFVFPNEYYGVDTVKQVYEKKVVLNLKKQEYIPILGGLR
jgi:hypothetical protein